MRIMKTTWEINELAGKKCILKAWCVKSIWHFYHKVGYGCGAEKAEEFFNVNHNAFDKIVCSRKIRPELREKNGLF